MIGQSEKRPTIETIGRLSGTFTARALTLFNVRRGWVMIFPRWLLLGPARRATRIRPALRMNSHLRPTLRALDRLAPSFHERGGSIARHPGLEAARHLPVGGHVRRIAPIAHRETR